VTKGWKINMKELARLHAQNKILRELVEAFIDATNPSPENVAFSAQKTLHIRMKSIALLKRMDDFSAKRLSKVMAK
jgi:hypothetical protein